MKTVYSPILLVGATGTGKSAAAMEIARDSARAGVLTSVLCMDAMQVYRGADLGTSKPTATERAELPHGGVDLVEFGQPFDVAQYLKHAEAFLREQSEAGRRVIIVGGTGLYFRALTRGLCEAPQGSDELRAELASLSLEQLQARLKAVDPAMMERLDASNPRRLTRAIEVMEATGKSLLAWQEETPEPLVREFTALWIQREKAELSQRIEARVEAMFAQGWVEEVRGLMRKYGAEAVRNFAGIGYREIGEMLGEPDPIFKVAQLSKFERGEGKAAMELRGQVRSPVQLGNEGKEGTGAGPATATLLKLKSDILVATRQYAKRQLTWFAREPRLRQAMLTGNQSLSAALSSAAIPSLL